MLSSITRAPDNSNFFLFPLKVRIIGILLHVYKQISIFHLFIYVSILTNCCAWVVISKYYFCMLLFNWRNSTLWTPLDCAAAKGHLKVASLLLEFDSPIDPTDKAKVNKQICVPSCWYSGVTVIFSMIFPYILLLLVSSQPSLSNLWLPGVSFTTKWWYESKQRALDSKTRTTTSARVSQ